MTHAIILLNSMPLTPGTILGQYEIRSPLGAGGMGEVYRARDTRLEREVAIKVLPESSDYRPRSLAPLRAGSTCRRGAESSQHSCGVPDGDARRRCLTWCRSCWRGDAAERLRRGPIPLRKAIDYGVQIAHGLAAAHEKGIVHRDLKPENLFVTQDGRVKILDFGLAKLVQPRDASGAEATIAPTLTELSPAW